MRKLVLILSQLVVMACASTPAPTPLDLSTYYPNMVWSTAEYLSGHNYLPDPVHPSWSVLWFELKRGGTYWMFNSNPTSATARCHYDQLTWALDGYLRYDSTTDTCDGDSEVTDYNSQSSSIVFLPAIWNGKPWTLSGKSTAVERDDHATCIGSNTWQASILGWEQVGPGEMGLHWRTSQTLRLTGSVCAPLTHWREDYWLVNDLPSPYGPERGLRRTTGGNVDSSVGRWDVRMDKWVTLPR